VRRMRGAAPCHHASASLDPNLSDLEDQLRSALGTKVRSSGKAPGAPYTSVSFLQTN